MSHSIHELQRIGVKFFLAAAPDLGKVIPVFHRWIQNGSVDGLLIDVANYSHVPQGPGVLLVGHEGNYGVDLTGNRPGVSYYRKKPLDGDIAERLNGVCAAALRAAALLEDEGFRLRGDELQVVANDRLLAPNDDETQSAFQPALDGLLDRLFESGARQLCRDEDPRERFNIDVKATKGADAATLLARISG